MTTQIKINELTQDIRDLDSTISRLKQQIKDQERQMKRNEAEIMDYRTRLLHNPDGKTHLVRLRDESDGDILMEEQGATCWKQANEDYEYLKKKMEDGEVEGCGYAELEWEWCWDYELRPDYFGEQNWEQERSEMVRRKPKPKVIRIINRKGKKQVLKTTER